MSNMVKMDKFGKIFFPKEIRNQMIADNFVVEIKENHRIELIPVRSITDLFGTLKGVKGLREALDEVHGEWEEHLDDLA